jgi:hypothetical protein
MHSLIVINLRLFVAPKRISLKMQQCKRSCLTRNSIKSSRISIDFKYLFQLISQVSAANCTFGLTSIQRECSMIRRIKTSLFFARQRINFTCCTFTESETLAFIKILYDLQLRWNRLMGIIFHVNYSFSPSKIIFPLSAQKLTNQLLNSFITALNLFARSFCYETYDR